MLSRKIEKLLAEFDSSGENLDQGEDTQEIIGHGEAEAEISSRLDDDDELSFPVDEVSLPKRPDLLPRFASRLALPPGLLPHNSANIDPKYSHWVQEEQGAALAKLERAYRDRLDATESDLARARAQAAQRELALQEELRQRDTEVSRLKALLESEVRALMDRQSQLEASAPAYQAQLAAARAQLHRQDLHISDAMYQELSQVPEASRPLADSVRMAVFEALGPLKSENERLRQQAATAQEVSQRCSEEADRARREAERAMAQCTTRERDASDAVEGSRSRIQRLEQELEDALLRAEVLSAKGTVYDELKARCDVLEEQARRAQGLEEALRALRAEADAQQRRDQDREHQLGLLQSERAHLSKQCDILQQQVARLEAEAAAKDARIVDLKRVRQQLYDKLLSDDEGRRGREEARVLQEVERWKRDAEAEVSRIRQEAADALERETRVLREMRDVAVFEQDRLRGQLKDLATEHGDLAEQLRGLRRLHDVKVRRGKGREIPSRRPARFFPTGADRSASWQVTELQAQLSIKSLEAEHARASLDDRTARYRALEAESDLLRDKCRVLGESLHALDAERARRVAELEERLASAREQLEQYEMIESNIDQAVLETGRLVGGQVLDLGAADMGQEAGEGPGAPWAAHAAAAISCRCYYPRLITPSPRDAACRCSDPCIGGDGADGGPAAGQAGAGPCGAVRPP